MSLFRSVHSLTRTYWFGWVLGVALAGCAGAGPQPKATPVAETNAPLVVPDHKPEPKSTAVRPKKPPMDSQVQNLQPYAMLTIILLNESDQPFVATFTPHGSSAQAEFEPKGSSVGPKQITIPIERFRWITEGMLRVKWGNQPLGNVRGNFESYAHLRFRRDFLPKSIDGSKNEWTVTLHFPRDTRDYNGVVKETPSSFGANAVKRFFGLAPTVHAWGNEKGKKLAEATQFWFESSAALAKISWDRAGHVYGIVSEPYTQFLNLQPKYVKDDVISSLYFGTLGLQFKELLLVVDDKAVIEKSKRAGRTTDVARTLCVRNWLIIDYVKQLLAQMGPRGYQAAFVDDPDGKQVTIREKNLGALCGAERQWLRENAPSTGVASLN